MIQSIKVDGIHGIKKELKFEKQSKIVGQSLLGKTSILNCIMACYSGYYPGYAKTIPKGKVELKTDAGDIIISNSKVVGNVFDDDVIRYIVPGNFFRLNPTTPKQREVLTKILDLDTDVLETTNFKLKEYQSELKEFNAKKDQITDDIIRLEQHAASLDGILEKPKKVEIAKDNSLLIQQAYDEYLEGLQDQNKKIEAENNKVQKEFEQKLATIDGYRAKEKEALGLEHKHLSDKLFDTQTKAEEAKATSGSIKCKECGTIIKAENKDELIKELRIKYKKDFDERELIIQKLTEIQDYIDGETLKIFEPEMKPLHEIHTIQPLAYKSKVTGIKYVEVDNSKHDQYLKDVADYNESETKRSTYLDEIKIKEEQLKNLNPIEIEKNIKKCLQDKKDFNKALDKKVKETGLDIRLFKIQKNGVEKETFEIYDDVGNMYGATSHGNELYIELLIAKLFVKYLKLDFILIDKFESIGINLRDKILKECEDLQIIATEVTKDKAMKVAKL